ncbi:MAG: HPr family phosphocarrier protein [Desulfobacter sp.]|nr:MAG: HPr family phosphocarrier protein [Desulfobacter sp.]
MDTEYSISRESRVVNALGMHARPAAKIAEMTMTAKGNIWLSDGSTTVDASSIIDILTLCAVTGTPIFIQAENKEDRAVADRIKDFFDQGFGEDINE